MTSPNRVPRSGWWRPLWPPGFRYEACYTRPRWSRTPPWPISPTSCWRATGRQRFTVPGSCMKQPADSRLTGSACFRRRQLSPARRDRVPTQRPTAGWTPSRIGGKLRACRLPRSRGEPGRISASWGGGRHRPRGLRHWRKATTRRSLPTKVLTRSRRYCATTASIPAMPRSSEPRGWSPSQSAAGFSKCSPAATVRAQANSASS
ncbi:Uncharacterised protein [Mycobacterium tuberculosis]|nr:Uncharacterised protein [Mycobacterium tuberculosis]COU84649.1 Uncharacterised protein [Mycobacterium tuberculosis]COV20811.1 Uncharacterised protein [Mycobacterium tuberculosis]COV26620.1 Uncharacterised protein [Mycobacterium tuberculosis]COV42697.1 Uncharacterised protein [Mycobacterium tuberculosis]